MAVKNVELMQECCPQHLRMRDDGKARNGRKSE